MGNASRQIAEPDWLATMRKILDYVEEKRNISVDIARIPLNDKKTMDLFKNGDAEGVFGFGAPDIQNFLKQLQPDSFNDLMVLCALYGLEGMSRPACFNLLPEYIARKTGKREIDCIHPDLEPIISHTYGLVAYQEQVTEILCAIAGYTPEKAETARRILAKKNSEKIAKLEPEFFCRCEAKGYNRTAVRKIWNLIVPYAGQLGRRSLVSIYAFTACQFAYLKAHYKSEFCAATIHTK